MADQDSDQRRNRRKGGGDATQFRGSDANPAPPSAPSPAPPPAQPKPATEPPGNEPGGRDARARVRRGHQDKPDNSVRIGTVLGGYTIEKHLGGGGMGDVWKVSSPLDLPFAIKTISSKLASYAEARASLRDEANHLVRTTHKSIVRYYNYADDPVLGIPYIVMEYIDGEDLADRLHALHPSYDEIVEFGISIAAGLEDAHKNGSIHCDLKPRNIMLGGGKLANAKVIDFGIGRKLGQGQGEGEGQAFEGSFSFAAPEQLQSKMVDARTDIYSLALVILALVQGRQVDMGGEKDALERRKHGPDLSIAPLFLRPTLRAMLKFDPAKRTQTMADVVSALTRLRPRRYRALYLLFEWVTGPWRDGSPLHTRLLWGGTGLLAALMLGLLLLLPSSPIGNSTVTPFQSPVVETPEPSPLPPQPLNVRAEAAIAQALPQSACAWIDPKVSVDGAHIELTGAADQVNAVAEQLRGALEPSIPVAGSDGMVPLDSGDCELVRAYRELRSSETNRLTLIGNSRLHISRHDRPMPGGILDYAETSVHLNFADRPPEFALISINRGKAELYYPNAESFRGYACEIQSASCSPRSALSALNNAPGMFEQRLPTTDLGTTGMILLTSDEPFTQNIRLVPDRGQSPAQWASAFLAGARGKIKAEAIWFCVSGKSDEQSRC